MKIKESSSVSTIPICRIPIGGCFKYHHIYFMRTANSYTDSTDDLKLEAVDLSTGVTSELHSNIDVYAVDAIIQINKVGVIDDTSK